ncbi:MULTISPECIES: hypothetical protein [Alphaproteobacteria]|uniref:hypothetical protein n=1 Tax=Alphaproteobacteria TaxID=28211 RepID=UPI0032632D86
MDIVDLIAAKAAEPKKAKYYNIAARERISLRRSIDIDPFFGKLPSRVKNLLSLRKNQLLVAAKSGHLDIWAKEMGLERLWRDENDRNSALGSMWQDTRRFHLIMNLNMARFQELPDSALAEIGLDDFDSEDLAALWIDKKREYYFSLCADDFAGITDEELASVNLGPETTSREKLWQMHSDAQEPRV